MDLSSCDIICYHTCIYQLFNLLNKEENEEISLQAILIKKGLLKLEGGPHYQLDSTFSSVYLIFDFDPQYHSYSKEQILYMAKRFNNETEEGLLLLNYPMYESILDIVDIHNLNDFYQSKIGLISSESYKKLVKQRTFHKGYNNRFLATIDDLDTFKLIAEAHKNKYLKIMNKNKYDGIKTMELLQIQLNEIFKNNDFFILNSMSILYFDYN